MELEHKSIPDFPGYEADTEGNIWSSWKRGPKSKHCDKWKKLKPLKGRGYLQIGLTRNGEIHKKKIHRLVLEAFVGACPEGMECCHNDGNFLNNSLENLRWDTRKNNQADRKKHGTASAGERHGRAKLTEYQVKRIRLMKNITPKLPQAKIGKMFNIARQTVGDILCRKKWKHI